LVAGLNRSQGINISMVYYYQGEKYRSIDALMDTVKMDIDGYLDDSGLDSIIRGCGAGS